VPIFIGDTTYNLPFSELIAVFSGLVQRAIDETGLSGVFCARCPVFT
jgi:hypothetical protein